VVHGIVTSLGGLIDVDSTPGVGTSMRVVLPAVVTDHSERTATGDVAWVPTTFGERRHRVLVVDDKELVQSFVQRALSSRGLDVTVASDGGAALRTLDDDAGTERAELSLAIVDVSMPGMGLADLIAGLRRVHPELPVIVMSGYGHHDVHELTADIQGFLQKPFRLDDLCSAVEVTLSRPLLPTGKGA
jgi:DNA-binding NtrC family response regulator